MPWHVSKTSQCSDSKPWGVILDATGKVIKGGCHKTKAEAQAHLTALNLNVPHAAAAPDMVTMPPLVTLPNVDIIAAGEWKLSTGPVDFTPENLADAVEAAACPAVGSPYIKIGHTDKRFAAGDGEPALGRVDNMALSASGLKITGDLAGMPGWLGAIASSAYPNRSIEGAYSVKCSIGHVHPFVITALALLGEMPPGIGVLNGLDDVAALYGVQATSSTLNGLDDVAALYGVQTTGSTTYGLLVEHPWITAAGGPMADASPQAAGVSTDDVRKAYYASGVPMSWWIAEMQMSPPQLIVCDEATDEVYRVPFKITGGGVKFSDPVKVEIEYHDVAATRETGMVLVYASAEDSRAGIVEAAWDAGQQLKNLGDNPSKSQLRQMFALPGDTKSDSKLPHHNASGGTVGAANDAGCSAAIAAINGGRGGLKGVSAADLKKAYSHLAAHLRADGKEPPEYSGPSAAGAHGNYKGTHSHPHSAYGGQGGDMTHEHAHTHAGDAQHDHAHASAGPDKGRSPEVDFTDEQMARIRAALGLADDEEITAEHVLAMAATVEAAAKAPPQTPAKPEEPEQEQVPAPVAASLAGKLPPGIVAMDKEQYEQLMGRIKRGEDARHRQLESDRERALDQAVRAGKFSVARVDHWRRLWNADPEGTEQVMAGLQRNLVPVGDLGQPGEEQDVLDTEYASLFPPQYERKSV